MPLSRQWTDYRGRARMGTGRTPIIFAARETALAHSRDGNAIQFVASIRPKEVLGRVRGHRARDPGASRRSRRPRRPRAAAPRWAPVANPVRTASAPATSARSGARSRRSSAPPAYATGFRSLRSGMGLHGGGRRRPERRRDQGAGAAQLFEGAATQCEAHHEAGRGWREKAARYANGWRTNVKTTSSRLVRTARVACLKPLKILERVEGIEPSSSAWKADEAPTESRLVPTFVRPSVRGSTPHRGDGES